MMDSILWVDAKLGILDPEKNILIHQTVGGSPGLVVMGGDSRQRSWVRIPAPDTGWT